MRKATMLYWLNPDTKKTKQKNVGKAYQVSSAISLSFNFVLLLVFSPGAIRFIHTQYGGGGHSRPTSWCVHGAAGHTPPRTGHFQRLVLSRGRLHHAGPVRHGGRSSLSGWGVIQLQLCENVLNIHFPDDLFFILQPNCIAQSSMQTRLMVAFRNIAWPCRVIDWMNESYTFNEVLLVL